VLRQLERGEVQIQFDPLDASVTIVATMPDEQTRLRRRGRDLQGGDEEPSSEPHQGTEVAAGRRRLRHGAAADSFGPQPPLGT
jgi:hypothetical protein